MIETVFVLLLFFGGGADGGRFISAPITFQLASECELALTQIAEAARSHANWTPFGVCVSKTQKVMDKP